MPDRHEALEKLNALQEEEVECLKRFLKALTCDSIVESMYFFAQRDCHGDVVDLIKEQIGRVLQASGYRMNSNFGSWETREVFVPVEVYKAAPSLVALVHIAQLCRSGETAIFPDNQRATSTLPSGYVMRALLDAYWAKMLAEE